MTSFSVKSVPFNQALSTLLPVIPTAKNARDICKSFCFSVCQNPDRLILRATDLEMFCSLTLDDGVMVESKGEFLAPAQTIVDFSRSVTDIEFRFVVEENGVIQLRTSDSTFEVGSQDLEEFPPFPEMPEGTVFEVEPEAFQEALEKVAFAVGDKHHPKYNFTAVCFSFADGVLSLVGSDSRRASVAALPLAGPPLQRQVLLSLKALEEIPKLFSQTFRLVVGQFAVVAVFKENYLHLPIINGAFPSVKDFLPKHPHAFSFDATQMLHYVKKACLAVDSQNTLRVSFGKTGISFSARTKEQRKAAQVSLEIPYQGPDFEFAVNGQHLIEVLKASKGEVSLQFNPDGGPLLFQQDSFQHLMVPMEV